MDLSNSCRDSPGGEAEEGGIKSCTHCQTTKTPLWRGGPSGPKTLCNACGIRYRKKVREAMGLQEVEQQQQKRTDKKGVSSLKIQMLGVGSQVMWKQRSWIQKQRRRMRRLGEVEQAAILLMALSSGLIYA